MVRSKFTADKIRYIVLEFRIHNFLFWGEGGGGVGQKKNESKI